MAESVNVPEKVNSRKTDKLKRHRERHLSFDLIRSSPQIKEKYRKDNQSARMATRPPQIEDLSGTINVQPINQGAIPKDKNREDNSRSVNLCQENISPAVRTMVTESVEGMKASLDRSINYIINEKMNKELHKVHESIAQLTSAVRNLAIKDNNRFSRATETGNRSEHSQLPNRFDFPQATPHANRFDFPQATSHANRCETSNNDPWKIRVDKFGLEFNGNQGSRDQMSLEDFVFRLEHMQRQYYEIFICLCQGQLNSGTGHFYKQP